MDGMEHTYITLQKCLLEITMFKALKEFYVDVNVIQKDRLFFHFNNLQYIMNDYLYPKIEYKNNPIPQEIWDDNEVESIRATYLMPEGTITEYKKELDHLADYDDKYWNEHWDDEDGY